MKEKLQARLKGKTFIVGIGNTLRGDDGVGPLLVESLEGKVKADLLDAGEVPESYLGRITDGNPDTIVLVDAVQMSAKPGSLAILEVDELTNINCSTHRLSLGLFMKYLRELTKADIFLVGIQPYSLEFDSGLTPEVEKSMLALAHFFRSVLGNT